MALLHNPKGRTVVADLRRERLYKPLNMMLLSHATLGLASQFYRFLPHEAPVDCKGMSLRPRRTEPVSIRQKETPLAVHGRNSENSLIELEQTSSLNRTLGGTPCFMKA